MKPTSLPTALGWCVSVVSNGRSSFRALAFVCCEQLGLGEAAAQPQPDQPEDAAQQERQPPAPGRELRLVQRPGQDEPEHGRDQHGRPGRDVEERRVPPATLRRRDLAQVRRRVRHLTAERQPLRDAGEQQQDRREPAHLRERRQQPDRHRPARHEQDGEDHGRLAAARVREASEQDSAERAEEERERVGGERVDQCQRVVPGGEERAGEVDAERRVDRPVEPLQRVARARREQLAHRQPVPLGCLHGGLGHGGLHVTRRCNGTLPYSFAVRKVPTRPASRSPLPYAVLASANGRTAGAPARRSRRAASVIVQPVSMTSSTSRTGPAGRIPARSAGMLSRFHRSASR